LNDRAGAHRGPHRPDGTRLTELAQQTQVTKQTAAMLVSALERGGYVERVPDPTDGRARLIRLAERGHAAAAVANAAVAEVEAEWVEYLGTKSITDLKRILTRLRVVTDPYR
jgi:DNA-binding MarR family transcriptional regulator